MTGAEFDQQSVHSLRAGSWEGVQLCHLSHVNGEDPIAIARALESAIEWRHEWGTDVVISMICYRCRRRRRLRRRRLGHN